MGLQAVNDTLANNYIRPDESVKAPSKVKESGEYSFIDKVKVRLVDSDYWAANPVTPDAPSRWSAHGH